MLRFGWLVGYGLVSGLIMVWYSSGYGLVMVLLWLLLVGGYGLLG